MTAYRGVKKDSVIRSLRDAEAVLQRLDLGPATDLQLSAWHSNKPFKKLASAAGDVAFGQAMEQTSRSFLIFQKYEPLFERLALNELLGNNEGPAVALYRTLTAWGAFHNNGMQAFTKIDSEVREFLNRKPEDYRAGLRTTPPLQRYGILIGQDDTMTALKSDLQNAAETLRQAGDVTAFHLGVVRPGVKGLGYTFNATAKAAQTIADALPHRTVHIFDGEKATICPTING
jgi:hypothetical protein